MSEADLSVTSILLGGHPPVWKVLSGAMVVAVIGAALAVVVSVVKQRSAAH